MFKDLRPNTLFYVLYRGETPKLETGTVVSVSPPMPKPPTHYNAMYPQQPEMVVDVKVKVGANTLTFEKLPAASAIADFTPGGGSQNVVVSTNRDMMRTEVEAMLGQSRAIVESIGYHQKVVGECEAILHALDPSYAKGKEREDEIKGLKDELSTLRDKLGGIDEIKKILAGMSQKGAEPKKPQP